jgi:superfamily II DNA/RNA helicase
VAYLMEFKQNLGPFLVIVPLSTLSNWVNEFQKWCPSAHTICYKGTPGQRKELYKDQVRTGHFNVLLTTYEYIIKDKASLRKITWQYAIVDEGHRMKNSQSKFAVTLSTQYTTKYRLLLTGTPLMNDLSELWALLNFLLPTIFNSVETFDQWFNKPFSQFASTTAVAEDDANFLNNEERMFIIHRLHELLRPFMLRRVKSEVLDQLPEKVEKLLRCELSSWQKELYKQISSKAIAENSTTGTGFVQPQQASRGLNNVVMQLRKVCNHPYLFSPEGYHINEKIIRSSGKIELLDRMLPKLRAAGHRVLLFTQMTAVMTILEDYFAYRGYTSLRLDGSTPAEEREKRMYKFNAPDSPYFIFLLSTRAGGLGLNLTAADTVIIFDSDWNPMMDLQAQDRAHRIGQRSDVSVFRLITYSPVEEKILSRATEKLNMSELVVEAGQFDKRSVENDNSLERKRLMEVLLTDFGTNNNNSHESERTSVVTGSEDADEDNDEENGSDNENVDREDLNDLLSNNELDYQLYDKLDEELAKDKAAVDASLYVDQDDVPDWIKYPSGKKNAALQDMESTADGSRKRKEVMYDDGLTEKQFLRMVDKQAIGEEAERAANKASRQTTAAASTGDSAADSGAVSAATGSELTDWTFRKIISCTKSVIALKDPSTKRRLCEVFLERPSPEQYPDYYEMIEKPLSINDILRKCRVKLYANMHEFREDWRIIIANAKQFNGEGSWVVEDAKALERELERLLKKNGFNEDSIPKPSPPKKKKLRIKLSLKSLKEAKKPEPEPEEQPEEEIPTKSSRGRKTKKRKRST